MNQFIALRFEHARFDDVALKSAIQDIQGTRYSLEVKDEHAPSVTHCISAVRYIIQKSTSIKLPHVYIGDFIPYMLHHKIAGARLVLLSEHHEGDLVFFHRASRRLKARMVTHVGLLIDDKGHYIHSTNDGGIIQNICASYKKGSIVTCSLASRYADPRSASYKTLRNRVSELL